MATGLSREACTVREAIAQQLAQSDNQGGEQPGGYGPDMGTPTETAPEADRDRADA